MGAFAPGAEELLDDVVVGLRPVDAAAELPDVDEVADDAEGVELMVAQEVEQGLGLAAAGAEMDIGDPAGAVMWQAALGLRPRPKGKGCPGGGE